MPRVIITNRQNAAFILPSPIGKLGPRAQVVLDLTTSQLEDPTLQRLMGTKAVTVAFAGAPAAPAPAPAAPAPVVEAVEPEAVEVEVEPEEIDAEEPSHEPWVPTEVAALLTAFGTPYATPEPVVTTDATPTTLLSITVPVDSVIQIMTRVVGRDQAGGRGAAYLRFGTYRNDGGTIQRIGSTVTTMTNEDSHLCDVTIVPSEEGALVRVAGIAGATFHWMAVATVLTVY